MDKTTPNQNLIYGVIGLLLGIVLTVLLVNNQMYGMMRVIGMGGSANIMQRGMMDETGDNGMMGMSMMEMNDELKGKTGDDFDKVFISGMIAHHQGAIDMATEAKKSAKHDEIKTMADAIISAQSSEIDQMKGWYKSWYGTEIDMNTEGMSH